MEMETAIENPSKRIWLRLVHFGHHHGQEATMAWSSGAYILNDERLQKMLLWRAEKEKSMSWDKKRRWRYQMSGDLQAIVLKEE